MNESSRRRADANAAAGARTLAGRLTPAELAALDEFLGAVRAMLGDELKEARLFGSRSRGEGGTDSDLDVALVVTAGGRGRRREVHDLAYETMLRHGIAVSPLVIEETVLAGLRSRERRIALDLEREGIVL
ncbi:MAG TPA: nucleotidyltransferase domain-containing protein [Thermoanaerobaculia bacterium]|nr:nucleotidyltransferase domain-containing protein [Thermoanaerobaculia bacterium]